MVSEEIDHRLPPALLDRPLDRMERIFWVRHLESVAIEIELSLRHAEDIGMASIERHNVTEAALPKPKFRVALLR